MESQREHGDHNASKTVGQIKTLAADAVKSARDAVDDKREVVAGTLDDTADAVDKQLTNGPDAAQRPGRAATDTLKGAAAYVRENDARKIGRDAVQTVTDYPVAALVLWGAAIVGGGWLLAAVVGENAESTGRGANPSSSQRLSSAVDGLGSKGSATLHRLRDAAVSFAFAKVVDTVEEMFPGFKEHYERT